MLGAQASRLPNPVNLPRLTGQKDLAHASLQFLHSVMSRQEEQDCAGETLRSQQGGVYPSVHS